MLKKKTWIVYILRCVDDTLYTGITTDLDARIIKHNQGVASKYTRSRRPVTLVWHEEADSESMARKREAAIKGWTRTQKMELLKKTTL